MRKLQADQWPTFARSKTDPITTSCQHIMSFKAPDSLSEQIARHIGQLIITGAITSGDRIQELRIASELNVSRGSVREAFLILERRYLIDIIPRKGAVVSAMSKKHVKNVYEMNVLLLALLIRKAVANWQDKDLEPFLGLIAEMVELVKQNQPLEFLDATFNFAKLAYQFSDNVYLEDMLDDLQPSIRRTYYHAINLETSEMEKSLTFFQALMERIIARDAEGAVAALEVFGEHQCQTVLAHIEE